MILWRGSVPPSTGEYALPGLSAPVAVFFDDNGVPIVRASTPRDGYRAIGYLHARDRLWQMEITRRIGAGRLSELLGERTLSTDKYLRTIGLSRLAEKQAELLTGEIAADLQAYVDGVNHWIENRNSFLPIEFQILRHEPEPWTAADSLIWGKLMAFQLSTDYRAEQRRVRLLSRLSPDHLNQLLPSNEWGPITLSPSVSASVRAIPPTPSELTQLDASNAWVTTPERTATGKSLLANDPHLALGLPAVWYPVRLETPELILTGVTAPGVPLHVLGHNNHIAWGMTTTYADSQDLVAIQPDPENPGSYLTANGSLPYLKRIETIGLGGDDSIDFEIFETIFGPVLPSADASNKVALQWTGLDPSDRTPQALHALNRARNWMEFLQSLQDYGAPIQNVFYADSQGNIGVAVPGAIPIRMDNTDGVLPKRSDENGALWLSVHRGGAAHVLQNPPAGQILNANNRVTPPGALPTLAWRHRPPHRVNRLAEVLGEENAHTLQQAKDLQLDTVSVPARILIPIMIRQVHDERGLRRQALDILRSWDFTMDRELQAPLIYRAWVDALFLGLVEDDIGQDLAPVTPVSPGFLKAALTTERHWCDRKETDHQETCADIVTEALDEALAGLDTRFGADIDTWRWGDAHVAPMQNRFLNFIPGLDYLSSHPVATSGGDHTLMRGQTGGISAPNPFANIHGAGYRAVYDMGDPDNSVFAIAGGVSGNPASPYYSNLVQDWADGRYFRIEGRHQDRKNGSGFLSLVPPN